MKIKKIPSEIVVEVEDARFIFQKPTALDVFELETSNPRKNVEYLLGRLKRIEGIEFEDGSKLEASHAVDLPFSVLMQVVKKYATELGEIVGTSKKKETETSGSENS